MRVLIVGAGGHGEVVADALGSARRIDAGAPEVIGFLDDDPERWGTVCADLPVLGAVAAARSVPHDALVVAVGNNRVRCRVMRELAQIGEIFATVIHPSAVIAASAEIGPGSMICAGAVINPGARLGLGVIINTCASVDHHNQIGDCVHMAPGAHTGGNVVIEEGAFIGMGARVIPACRIGAWAVVGAGATVIRNVPEEATVVGTPARVIKETKEPC